MELGYRQEQDILITTLAGRLESAVATQVEQSLLQKIDEGFVKIVFDLSHTEYITSAGLRVLLVAAKRTRTLGGMFRLCSANEENLKVLEVVGFLDIIEYTHSLDEALRPFSE